MRQAGLSAEFKNYQWGQLMLSIAKGAVVPVIGPELLSVEVDGRDVNLYRHVAERLALELDMEPPCRRMTISGMWSRTTWPGRAACGRMCTTSSGAYCGT